MNVSRLRSRQGFSPIWTIVISIILISFSLLVYTGMTMQSNYRQAQAEIERAAHVSLNASLENRDVRDINLAADIMSVQLSFEQNLIQTGYLKTDEQTWQRTNQDKVIYTLEHLHLTPDHDRISLSGIIVLPLIWGPSSSIEIPFSTSVQVLFINP
jgi:hypothetical protein